ncbi:MAG TPA: hypothetical protein VN228_22320, partial [Pyrinomonadaceae bacterium]|nr:hypothetical protein [Pyrinomonadaceae bacterium]
MSLRTILPFILTLLCAPGAAAQTAGAASANAAAAPRHQLMPVPASVSFGEGRLPVTKSFTVAARGHKDARLLAGVERALRRLEGRTVMELPRGLSADAAA